MSILASTDINGSDVNHPDIDINQLLNAPLPPALPSFGGESDNAPANLHKPTPISATNSKRIHISRSVAPSDNSTGFVVENSLIHKSMSNPELSEEKDKSNDNDRDKDIAVVEAMSSLDSATLLTPMINASPQIGLPSFPSISPSALPTFDPSAIPDLGEQFNSFQMRSTDDLGDLASFAFSSTTSLGMDSQSDNLEINLPSPENANASDFDFNIAPSGFLPTMPMPQEAMPRFLGDKDMEQIEVSLLKTCSICLEAIEEKGVFANGQFFHKKCFLCHNCNRVLGEQSCVMYKEHLLCFECARMRKSQTVCISCNELIVSTNDEITIPEIGRPIHKNCLSCFECGQKVSVGQQYSINGRILCQQCNDIVLNRKCAKCGGCVVGQYVENLKKIYHPEHFQCVKCGKVLHGKAFVMHHNLPYCFTHGEIFLSTCAFCKGHFKLNETDKIKWNGKLFHNSCFVCRICGCPLDPNACKRIHGRPHCKQCFVLRKEDGDCDDSGRNLVSHHHHSPVTEMEKREKYHTTRSIFIIHPIYGNNVLEEAETSEDESQSNFINF